jgi:hypothetical protein
MHSSSILLPLKDGEFEVQDTFRVAILKQINYLFSRFYQVYVTRIPKGDGTEERIINEEAYPLVCLFATPLLGGLIDLYLDHLKFWNSDINRIFLHYFEKVNLFVQRFCCLGVAQYNAKWFQAFESNRFLDKINHILMTYPIGNGPSIELIWLLILYISVLPSERLPGFDFPRLFSQLLTYSIRYMRANVYANDCYDFEECRRHVDQLLAARDILNIRASSIAKSSLVALPEGGSLIPLEDLEQLIFKDFDMLHLMGFQFALFFSLPLTSVYDSPYPKEVLLWIALSNMCLESLNYEDDRAEFHPLLATQLRKALRLFDFNLSKHTVSEFIALIRSIQVTYHANVASEITDKVT